MHLDGMRAQIKHNNFKMVMKNIYKNLHFDTEGRGYWFIDGEDKRQVVNQEAYLLIYILELLQERRIL